MDSVGFEMYMKLLEDTVRELKGEELDDDVRATVNLRVDLKIDETVHPRHEPAADGLPADCLGAQRRGDRPHRGRSSRPLRPDSAVDPEPGRLRPHPGDGRPPRHRGRGPGGREGGLPVPAADDGRSRPLWWGWSSAAATSRSCRPAGLRLDLKPAAARARSAAAPEGRRPTAEGRPPGPWANIGQKPLTSSDLRAGRRRRRHGRVRRPGLLVDGPRHSRRGHRGVHEGRNPQSRPTRPPRRRRASLLVSAGC